MPLPAIAVVSVEEVGMGLVPGDASSVEPNGIPVGETDEPDVIPSGEVAPMAGVGTAIAPTCASATWLTKSAGRTATVNESRLRVLRGKTAPWRLEPMPVNSPTGSLGASASDIGQSPQWWRLKFNQRAQMLNVLSEDSPSAVLRGVPKASARRRA